MTAEQHALSIVYTVPGGEGYGIVWASCSCGWGSIPCATQRLAMQSHNHHVAARRVNERRAAGEPHQ